MRKILVILLTLMLVACAGATSQSPNISDVELAHEQAEQKKIIDAEKKKTKVTANIVTESMVKRFKRVANRIHTSAKAVCKDLKAKNCDLPFEVDKKNIDSVNAYTDGKRIVVSPAMLNFADTDDQLATVLSHEYAHAIMNHPEKTGQNTTVGSLLGLAVDTLAGSQGMNTKGMFSKIGAQSALLKYSQGFETEADYVGMYILKRAGYNIDKAANLWRRMAVLNPKGIYVGSTHPTSAQRYLLLDKTAKEIKAKQRYGQKLLPTFKPKDK